MRATARTTYTALCVVLLAAACSSPPAAPDRSIEPVQSTSQTPVPPSGFVNRPELANCGRAEPREGLRQLEELLTQDAINCLSDSRTRSGGELVITALTIEGDPVTTYFRTAPNSPSVDIYIDQTRDRYGSSWHHTTCQAPLLTSEALVGCLRDY